MDKLIKRAESGFRRAFGGRPDGSWAAPARINVLGEHTDYNNGFVMPYAIPFYTVASTAKSSSPTWQVWSEASGEKVTLGPSRVMGDEPERIDGWAAYVAGVIWALRQEVGNALGGARIAIASDVPLGAGLSSSAALEISVLCALRDLYDLDISPREQVKVARRAENEYVGAPTGILDQTASLMSRQGHALFLDCRSEELELIPFDVESAGLEMIVIDSGVRHSHADGEYADRRRDCERSAKLLGVDSLRDVNHVEYLRLPDQVLRRRVRHVATENARTVMAARALQLGRLDDLRDLGSLLTESHLSLMADFEVSCRELDVIVEAAIAGGAWGARMTGGGFGGCVIALVNADQTETMCDEVVAELSDLGHPEPVFRLGTPSPGARQVRD